MHPFRPVPAILCRVSNVTGRLIHDPHTPFFISVLFQLSWFGNGQYYITSGNVPQLFHESRSAE